MDRLGLSPYDENGQLKRRSGKSGLKYNWANRRNGERKLIGFNLWEIELLFFSFHDPYIRLQPPSGPGRDRRPRHPGGAGGPVRRGKLEQDSDQANCAVSLTLAEKKLNMVFSLFNCFCTPTISTGWELELASTCSNFVPISHRNLPSFQCRRGNSFSSNEQAAQ